MIKFTLNLFLLLIIFIISYFFYSIQWIILSIIFFIFSGILLLITYLNRNQNSKSQNVLMCPKCQIGNSLYNLNNNPHSTIFIYRENAPKIKPYEGLNIFLLLCFKCKKITEWTSDSSNISKNAKFGFEYFKSRVITKKDINDAMLDAEQSCSVDSLKKLKKINEEI
jgi:hypothetical protein